MKTPDKQYILKPGNHQFAPGSPAEHNNDNTSDEEAAFYLNAYPHIIGLFEKTPVKENPAKVKANEAVHAESNKSE